MRLHFAKYTIMNKINFYIKLLFVSCILSGSVSFAENNPSINKDGHAGLVSAYTAKSLGKFRLAVTSYGDFSYDKDFIKRVLLPDTFAGDVDTLYPVGTVMTLRPNIAFGITDYLDVGVSLPVYFDIMEGFSPQGGVGDLKLSWQFRIPGKKDRLSDFALLAAMTVPTGAKSNGYFSRSTLYIKNSDSLMNYTSYYSSKSIDFDIEALWRLNLDWFGLYLNSGCIIPASSIIDNMLILRGAIEIKPKSNFSIFTEINSETRFKNLSNGFRFKKDPIWLVPGISITTDNGAVLTFSGGFNLASGKEISYYDRFGEKRFSTRMQPSWRIAVQLGWSGVLKNVDSDNDLVSDSYDKCPDAVEDADGFDDHDGCPDVDNDNDGVIDNLDKCPDEAEDMDNFEDDDGCPEWDNDRDAIKDTVDKCPDVAEDIDGVSDTDGCPDTDNDFDGVNDLVDKCINSAEDKDNFEDSDGCPDRDNDTDGIPDSLDNCPDKAGIQESMGCPKRNENIKEIKAGKIILAGVGFEPKTVQMVASAYRILDQLFESLMEYSDVKIEIRSHTDSFGGPESNQILTQKRAEAVTDYLVNKGISRDRLIPIGKGDAEPIADNRATPGRQLNNRIEIFRIN